MNVTGRNTANPLNDLINTVQSLELGVFVTDYATNV